MVILKVNFIPGKPAGFRQFVGIQGDDIVPVKLREESHQKTSGKCPGLAFIVSDILHLKPHLFHDFPGNCLLSIFANFCKSCNQGISGIGSPGISAHKKPIFVDNTDNYSRRNSGIDSIPAGGTIKHSLFVVR